MHPHICVERHDADVGHRAFKNKSKSNSKVNYPTSAKNGQICGTSKINYPTLAKNWLGWGTLKFSFSNCASRGRRP